MIFHIGLSSGNGGAIKTLAILGQAFFRKIDWIVPIGSRSFPDFSNILSVEREVMPELSMKSF
jgi:hypothetical protein